MTPGNEIGIASLGVALPPRAMDVRALAELRGVDPDKFTLGLGCKEMALCTEDTDVATLATKAARRALGRWDGDLETLALVAVGTETAKDMSRPLSAFVAEGLGLAGPIRSYEVKHACYGGTLALRQALEWKASGAGAGKAALVVAADVALYAPCDPGEPTQGAGAVAMIVGDASIASVDLATHAYSAPAFDFYRPVGEAYPRVDGPLSLECYMRGAAECFASFVGDRDAKEALSELDALCFHVPFPKMVKKAVAHVGNELGIDPQTISALYESKVEPTMEWNRKTGNAYTASLWLSVARALAGVESGARIAAFSYGSGFGSELLTLAAGERAARAEWVADLDADLEGRELIDAETYERYRATHVPAH